MTLGADPHALLARALHGLTSPPAGMAWNHLELADLLPPGMALRPAAVLLALVERVGGRTVLFTRRTEALRHHAGQVSFPGGRIEACDLDPVAAALREAEEEVGMARTLVEPLGYLDPFVTITGFHVFPVVARVSGEFAARIDPAEVAEAFEAPLDFLLSAEALRQVPLEFQGRTRQIWEVNYAGHRIWGATAAILMNLRQRLENAA